MASLNVLPPSAEPRATEFVPQMVATIQSIIANGHAYALPDGDVYFDVATLPGYGRLSGRSQEDNRRVGCCLFAAARRRGAPGGWGDAGARAPATRCAALLPASAALPLARRAGCG